jgi:siroheme synthase
MNDFVKSTLREPEGPEPQKPELMEQIVEQCKDIGSSAKDAGKKYINAKADQESAKVREIEANIFTKAGELELKRQESLMKREKQNKELELQEKRDENAHIERMQELKIQECKGMMEIVLQEKQNRIAAFNAVTERLKTLKELGIEVNIQMTDLDIAAIRLLDSK